MSHEAKQQTVFWPCFTILAVINLISLIQLLIAIVELIP